MLVEHCLWVMPGPLWVASLGLARFGTMESIQMWMAMTVVLVEGLHYSHPTGPQVIRFPTSNWR